MLKNCFTQYDAKSFFYFSLKKLRIDLLCEMVKYMAWYRLSFSRFQVYLTLSFNFVCLFKTDTDSLFTIGVIKNIMLSCFNVCESSKWK